MRAVPSLSRILSIYRWFQILAWAQGALPVAELSRQNPEDHRMGHRKPWNLWVDGDRVDTVIQVLFRMIRWAHIVVHWLESAKSFKWSDIVFQQVEFSHWAMQYIIRGIFMNSILILNPELGT